jgi:hypothetical protein
VQQYKQLPSLKAEPEVLLLQHLPLNNVVGLVAIMEQLVAEATSTNNNSNKPTPTFTTETEVVAEATSGKEIKANSTAPNNNKEKKKKDTQTKKKQVEAVLQLALGYIRDSLSRQPTCRHQPQNQKHQDPIKKRKSPAPLTIIQTPAIKEQKF